jgi:hypothetical protein
MDRQRQTLIAFGFFDGNADSVGHSVRHLLGRRRALGKSPVEPPFKLDDYAIGGPDQAQTSAPDS